MEDGEILGALRRIASTLNLPMSAFYERCVPDTVESGAQAAQESIELLKAFAQITDPRVHRECLELVQTRACNRPHDRDR